MIYHFLCPINGFKFNDQSFLMGAIPGASSLAQLFMSCGKTKSLDCDVLGFVQSLCCLCFPFVPKNHLWVRSYFDNTFVPFTVQYLFTAWQ